MTDQRTDDRAEVARAVDVLRGGGLVAFPTETVYGLGADAANPDALHRLFRVKGRPPDHPVIVHVAGAVQLDELGRDVPALAHDLAAAFWPGPLTIVVRREPAASPRRRPADATPSASASPTIPSRSRCWRRSAVVSPRPRRTGSAG